MNRIVLRCYERDIVRVRQNGRYQGFYRSSGQCSGRPGVWFPFDGISVPAWFIKDKYSGYEIDKQGLHRYGTLENQAISERLAKENIKQGVDANEAEINLFVGNKEMAKTWEGIYEWRAKQAA